MVQLEDDVWQDIILDVEVSWKVYKGMLDFFKCIIFSLEQFYVYVGLGGMVSIFGFLEIVQIYYYSKELDKWKRSLIESVNILVGKDFGLVGWGDLKVMVQLRVFQVGFWVLSVIGKGFKELDIRSLKEENFIVFIGFEVIKFVFDFGEIEEKKFQISVDSGVSLMFGFQRID